MPKCIFVECRNAAEPASTKCVFHRHRTQCTIPFCPNQSYARGRCVRHGARKPCIMEGCTSYRRSGGYCSRHRNGKRDNSAGLILPVPTAAPSCPIECSIVPPEFCLNSIEWMEIYDCLDERVPEHDDATLWSELLLVLDSFPIEII